MARWAVLLLLVLGAWGCTKSVPGIEPPVGSPVLVFGELKSRERVSLERAHAAVLGALRELGYKITTDDKDAVAANVIGYGFGDTRANVKLKWVNRKITEVAIRVGTVGDEQASRLILERMRARY
jgi:hypothetical protein